MKSVFLVAGGLTVALCTTAAMGGKSKSMTTGSSESESMGTQGSSMSGTGGAATAGRQLFTNNVGKAVELQSEIAFYTPDELKWTDAPPSLPRGAKLAVLEGDPFVPNKHY